MKLFLLDPFEIPLNGNDFSESNAHLMKSVLSFKMIYKLKECICENYKRMKITLGYL